VETEHAERSPRQAQPDRHRSLDVRPCRAAARVFRWSPPSGACRRVRLRRV